MMDYLCGHYWNGEEEISLRLKQIVFHERQVGVVFAYVAEGENRRLFADKMTEWFYRETQKGFAGMEEALEDCLEEVTSQAKYLPETAGVLLCVEERFLLWKMGDTGFRVLNERFGSPYCREVFQETEGKEAALLRGVMEKGVGILLATKEFGSRVTGKQLAECLAVHKLAEENRLEKHLRELGEEGAREGGKHGAAVLVVTC